MPSAERSIATSSHDGRSEVDPHRRRPAILPAGYLARLLVPGPDPMSAVATIVLGIVGSFVGGFLGHVLFDKDLDEGALQASGVVGAIIGAVIVLLIYRAVGRGRLSRI